MGASRPTVVRVGGGRPGSARNTKFIRRGGIYCARRRVSEANRRAAAALGPEIPPAGVCAAAGSGGMGHPALRSSGWVAAVPVWPEAQNSFVGADSISARGVCAAAGFPGRYGIGPYRGLL